MNKLKHKILIYFTFIIASLVVVAAFVTAASYTQLAIAALFYPPLVYFAFKLFPRQNGKPYLKKAPVAAQPVNKSPSERMDTVDIIDIDKRAFLKLIGAAGLSYFIFSIFTKRAESMFFGRAPELGTAFEDRAGNKIDPAERQPTDGYQISDVDNGDFTYCGFTNKSGGWFILKEDEVNGSFRYVKGEADFSANWANRENLKYDYFHNVF